MEPEAGRRAWVVRQEQISQITTSESSLQSTKLLKWMAAISLAAFPVSLTGGARY